MHRHVVSYLLRHWNTPGALNPLAASLHRRLHLVDLRCLSADPWRCLFTLSARRIRLGVFGSPNQRRPLCLTPMINLLRQSMTQLPAPQRYALEQSVTSNGRSNYHVDDLPPLQLMYLTQARALMRCSREMQDKTHQYAAFPPLNEAKMAAFWAMHFKALDCFQREEFAQWLRQSPTHVRELLIACIDELLLGML